MAQSINTNPLLVRRLLGVLADAGLTSSQMGAGGGALLARDARSITLLDVQRAVDASDVFAMPREATSPYCLVGAAYPGVAHRLSRRGPARHGNRTRPHEHR